MHAIDGPRGKDRALIRGSSSAEPSRSTYCTGSVRADAGNPLCLSSMRYFLAKTDPETYTVDQLAKEKKTVWDGVMNPQAVRAIREMRPGDKVFIYHSGGQAAIVGLAKAISEPRP